MSDSDGRAPRFDLADLVAQFGGQAVSLGEQHVNPAFAKVLRVIGFDIHYVRGQGAYLWDDQGNRYIDCLAGFGVMACGRNHPVIRDALKQAMDLDLPNLVKMGAYNLSGLLARELLKVAPPGLERVYFTNCGASGVETAIKFARAATGREKIVYCKKGYHGLTLGALSVNGGSEFRDGFGSLLLTEAVPFNDLAALEQALSGGDVAGFILEPIQGKGVNIADDDYLPGVAELCRKHGTIYILDEVQTGFGRTGKMFACEHYRAPGSEPDILVTSKALSGGYVPAGAVLFRKWVHEKVFSSMDRCMVHSNTFGQNDLAMAAGLATLHVLKHEKLVENAAAMGKLLLDKLTALKSKYEMVKDVRGRGLMVAIEFGPPKGMLLLAQWAMLHKLDAGLFPQAILIPLLRDHHVLTQVAGHHQDVIKLIPPLVLSSEDVDHIVKAFDATIGACHTVGGPAWEVGKRLSAQALKRTAGV